jgi:hypothetical protein
MRLILMLMFFAVLTSCAGQKRQGIPADIYAHGVLPVIEIHPDTTLIDLSDFFSLSAIEIIDSVTMHQSVRHRFNRTRNKLMIFPRTFNLPAYFAAHVWVEGNPISFLMKNSGMEKQIIRFNQGENRYRNVSLVGDMTGWEPLPMNMINGVWELTLHLKEGVYHYYFVVDRRQIVDPENPVSFESPEGMNYSVLNIVTNRTSFSGLRLLSSSKRTLIVSSDFEMDDVFVLWQNHLLHDFSVKGNIVEIRIPKIAHEKDISYLRIAASGNNKNSDLLTITLGNGMPLNQK